jgi:hypothetical protein
MSTGANSPYDDINRQVNALRVRSETSLPPNSPKRALDNSDDQVASEAKKGRQKEATFTPNTADQAIAGSSTSNQAGPNNSEGHKTRKKTFLHTSRRLLKPVEVSLKRTHISRPT